jgi:hypothetical protein
MVAKTDYYVDPTTGESTAWRRGMFKADPSKTVVDYARPCRRGHLVRYRSTGRCAVCAREKQNKYDQARARRLGR